jgi:1,2-diacylglycerol 3-beta-galactosyltransferase
MILRPHFYTPVTVDREMERRKLGLKPGVATGLVLFGGQGSKVMLDIARRLQTVKRDLQLIFICGRNKELAEGIRAVESRLPVFVEEFTSQVPYYMRLADFFIGKPGPACISEAVAMNLPVIVERNARTMPQERYNVEWLLENNAGIVVRSFRRIASAVEQLLEPPNLERYRAGAASVKNRAVFEIPGMLAAILEKAPPAGKRLVRV